MRVKIVDDGIISGISNYSINNLYKLNDPTHELFPDNQKLVKTFKSLRENKDSINPTLYLEVNNGITTLQIWYATIINFKNYRTKQYEEIVNLSKSQLVTIITNKYIELNKLGGTIY